jgi:hypothetical protein
LVAAITRTFTLRVCGVPQAFDLTLLQDAQQLALRAGGEGADLVQEEGAAIGPLESGRGGSALPQ